MNTQIDSDHSWLCHNKKRMILATLVFIIIYFALYIYVRHRWETSSIPPRVIAPYKATIVTSYYNYGYNYETHGRDICYFIFWPLIRLDILITGHGFIDSSGNTHEPGRFTPKI